VIIEPAVALVINSHLRSETKVSGVTTTSTMRSAATERTTRMRRSKPILLRNH